MIAGAKIDTTSRRDSGVMWRSKSRPPPHSGSTDKGSFNDDDQGSASLAGVLPWDTGGMYTVELYARVRRAVHVEGRSQREVAREFGLPRKTVRKMLAYSLPPGYQRQKPVRRPKLGPWQAAIDAILEEDKSQPATPKSSPVRR